jgi:hypothetical protein
MIDLNLTLNDINLILQALGQAPYAQVAELVDKIKEQATPQAQALQESQPVEAAVVAE